MERLRFARVLLDAATTEDPTTPPVAEHPERRRILEALERCAWNQTEAATLLGVSRRTLVTRLDTYAIPRPRKGKGAPKTPPPPV